MPFGLCNASATFERLMEKVLHEVLHKICLVYLDDFIYFSKTFTGTLNNLREVFLRLREVNLKINPKKYSLFRRKVRYLDHIISEKGIITDPEKTTTIENWLVSKNKKQIRRIFHEIFIRKVSDKYFSVKQLPFAFLKFFFS